MREKRRQYPHKANVCFFLSFPSVWMSVFVCFLFLVHKFSAIVEVVNIAKAFKQTSVRMNLQQVSKEYDKKNDERNKKKRENIRCWEKESVSEESECQN